MKKLKIYAAVIGITAAVAMSSCTKDDSVKPVQAKTLHTITMDSGPQQPPQPPPPPPIP